MAALRSESVALLGSHGGAYGGAYRRPTLTRPCPFGPPIRLDFAFQLDPGEFDGLKSQIVISKTGRGGRRSPPWAFTEHGASIGFEGKEPDVPADPLLANVRNRKAGKQTRVSPEEILAQRDADRR